VGKRVKALHKPRLDLSHMGVGGGGWAVWVGKEDKSAAEVGLGETLKCGYNILI
jgi:hypothetical protein